MSRDDIYKLEKIEEILGVDSLQRSLGWADDNVEKLRKKLRKAEDKLEQSEARIEVIKTRLKELESCGEGKYGRYIDSDKGPVRMFVNKE